VEGGKVLKIQVFRISRDVSKGRDDVIFRGKEIQTQRSSRARPENADTSSVYEEIRHIL
jgi:hypothetical protein